MRRRVAGKAAQGRTGEMTNDEFGMSNWLNFVIRTSAFELPAAIAVMHEKHGIACDMIKRFTWDPIDRRPRTGGNGIYLEQRLENKWIEHKQSIGKHWQDLPELRN